MVSGGGIFSTLGTVKMRGGTTVTGNRAGDSGGGIFVQSPTGLEQFEVQLQLIEREHRSLTTHWSGSTASPKLLSRPASWHGDVHPFFLVAYICLSMCQTALGGKHTQTRTPDSQVELIIEGEQIVSANRASRGGGISMLDATLEVEREWGNLVVRGNAAGRSGGGLDLVGSRLVAWGNVSIEGNEVAGEGAQPRTPKISSHAPEKYLLEPGRASASHLIH